MKKDGFLISVICALGISVLATVALACVWIIQLALVNSGQILEVSNLWGYGVAVAIIDGIAVIYASYFLFKRNKKNN